MAASPTENRVTLEDLRRLGELQDAQRYAEAVALADTYIDRDPRYDLFEWRARLRLWTGDLRGARDDFLKYRYPSAVFRPEVRWIGVALWLQGKRAEACEDWANEIGRRRAKEISHTDTAGGVLLPSLLWWATAHPELRQWRRLAVEELRRRWRTARCQESDWPGPLAPFLLGQISEAELVAKLSRFMPPPKAPGSWCQLDFYRGARALEEDDTELYQNALEAAAPPDDPLRARTEEYVLARYELDPENLPWLRWAVTP